MAVASSYVIMVTRRYAWRASVLLQEILEAGLVAGLVGGVAMALFASIYSAAFGPGFFAPVEAIGSTVLRDAALASGPGPAIVGLAFHLLVSMFFGVVFALVTPREVEPAPALAFGLFGGMFALVIMSLVVVPLANPAASVKLMWGSSPGAVPVWVAVVMHLLFGAGLALAPGLRRRFHPLPSAEHLA